MVTLEGALIDVSGTMSGGGAKVAKGGMASKIVDAMSPAELAALEKDLERNVKQLNEQRETKMQMENKVCY